MSVAIEFKDAIVTAINENQIKAPFYEAFNTEQVKNYTSSNKIKVTFEDSLNLNVDFGSFFKSANQNVTAVIDTVKLTDAIRLFYFECKKVHHIDDDLIRSAGITVEAENYLAPKRTRFTYKIINSLNRASAREVLLGANRIYGVPELFNNNTDMGILFNKNTKHVVVEPTTKYNEFVARVSEAVDWVTGQTQTSESELRIILFGNILKYVNILQEGTTKTIEDYLKENWKDRRLHVGNDILGLNNKLNGFVVLDPNSIFVYELFKNEWARDYKDNKDEVAISDYYRTCNRPVVVANNGAYFCEFKEGDNPRPDPNPKPPVKPTLNYIGSLEATKAINKVEFDKQIADLKSRKVANIEMNINLINVANNAKTNDLKLTLPVEQIDTLEKLNTTITAKTTNYNVQNIKENGIIKITMKSARTDLSGEFNLSVEFKDFNDNSLFITDSNNPKKVNFFGKKDKTSR